jgi:DNA-directed RNA polymerase subunit alpha
MSNFVASINERAADEYFRRARDADGDGNGERSIEFYEMALRENPDHEQASFELAVIYDRRGEDSKAIELYERLCAGAPVYVNALMNLAILYEDNNFFDDARRCLEAVLLSRPEHGRAKLYLKDVMAARQMYVDDLGGDGDKTLSMEVPITDFDLSVRARNALKKMNVRTLGELLRIGEQELLAHKNFGETSLNEIKSLLAARGLRLGQTAEPVVSVVAASPARRSSASSSPASDSGDEIMARSIGDIELSVRSRKALQRLNIATVGELAGRTEDELLGCKNFGQTSLNELKQVLAQFGITFRKLDS